tara:strand:- start:359 stop:544 length:186 start_codon:yes stop_codon:yes gene_type:complete
MNFEACLKATINDSVVHALERMKTLDPESRSQLFLEMADWIFCDFDIDDELIVPLETENIN